MNTAQAILIVGTECPAGISEEEWNKWYSEHHVRLVLKFKGVRKADRYKRIGTDRGEYNYPTYLAVYEFDNLQALEEYNASPESDTVGEDWDRWVKKGAELNWWTSYEHIKTIQK